jgi:hypothetical protein
MSLSHLLLVKHSNIDEIHRGRGIYIGENEDLIGIMAKPMGAKLNET